MLLGCALLAPKVSLAAASLFGNGYDSVVICTSGGLARVTVGPDRALVDDLSEVWIGTHCVPSDGVTLGLQRRWQALRRSVLRSLGALPPPAVTPVPRARQPAVSSRGPPLV